MKKTTHPAFENALKSLNPAQQKAVNTIDGPVMVLAGPGTGKTQILAARIGHILVETDTDPRQILCLTYTEAGVVAMRKRLIQFIGPDAHLVHIHTFHSFCNWIIQSNPEKFPGLSAEPISELEKIEITEMILNSLPPDHVLRNLKGSNVYNGRELRNLFDIMKDENWTSGDIIGMVDSFMEEKKESGEYEYKRNTATAQKGDFNINRWNKDMESLEKLKEASRLFETVEEEKRKRGLYDFKDMIQWVDTAFKEDEDFLRDYQERFLYIMVDEFQDTNGSQQAIVDHISSYWDSPNLFVVGDDDQSIYRFQGANIQNIIEFSDRYRDHITPVVLTTNYRSTQKILEVADAVITQNHERLINLPEIKGLNKDLTAFRTEDGPDIRTIEYSNDVHEAVGIGIEIENLINSGVSSNEIAILYRKHQQAEEVMNYLKNKKIPIKTKKRVNVLELPTINAYLDCLKYVVVENKKPHSGESVLFRILHLDHSVSPLDIARVVAWINEERYKGNYYHLREALSFLSEKKGAYARLQAPDSIIRMAEKAEQWIRHYHDITISGLAEKVLHNGGFIDSALKSGKKGFYLEALSTVFHFIQGEARKNPSYPLEKHLERIDLMVQHNVELSIEQIINDQNGIQFMTVHSSKGLEFEHVFMVGCTKKIWENSRNNKPFGLHKIVPGDPEQVIMEESRRLFFVGMTRAKTNLTMSYPAADLNGKEKQMSLFLTEAQEAKHCNSLEVKVDPEDVEEFLIQSGMSSESRLVHLLDDDLLERRLQNYQLSVTHLNNYLRCPIDFYFSNLLRVPSMKNKYMGYGTAVHKALERLIRERGSDKYNSDYLLEQFKNTMERERASFTDQEFDDLVTHGDRALKLLFDHYHKEWLRPDDIKTELNVDGVVVRGVPIKGQLDKVEVFDKDINVVDYKTGKPENATKKLKPPQEVGPDETDHEKIYGGDYWRQLVFYALLINGQTQYPWNMMSGEMDFVEQKKNEEFMKHKWFYSEEDMEIVSDQIESVYGKIMNREFSQGCNDEHCEWCQFVKEHYPSAATAE